MFFVLHKLRWNHADCVLWDAVSFFVLEGISLVFKD
ncbi:hypothetical protein L897_02325 [Streptococcus pyogenes HSC5]|nr:hypothetical protein L897_02325 [Streptococcus pyogenes HSC5]